LAGSFLASLRYDPLVAERAPAGWKTVHEQQAGPSFPEGFEPEMKVTAIIQEPAEIDRILRHLVEQGRPPPGLDPNSLNCFIADY
jgi:hypothetical protein